ncbi:MAG: hypothetical protein WBA68_07685, partial [Alteraurantiacibacter sp.]
DDDDRIRQAIFAKRAFAALCLNSNSADKTDLGFFLFADASSLRTCSGFLAALQPALRMRPLLAGFERLIQSALSLHGVWTRKTWTFPPFATSAPMSVQVRTWQYW